MQRYYFYVFVDFQTRKTISSRSTLVYFFRSFDIVLFYIYQICLINLFAGSDILTVSVLRQLKCI